MDEKVKTELENLYTSYCITLTESGNLPPIFFLFKDNIMFPVLLGQNMEISFELYASLVINKAQEADCDAIAFISEQYVVQGKKNDECMQPLLNGTLRPSEHPDKKECLVLVYMDAYGKSSSLLGEIKQDLGGTRYIEKQSWTDNTTSNLLNPWK